jgi:hypothetical protein
MIEAGLTIALVDPVFQQMCTPGVVFRPLAGRGVFTEMGVIYRRDDSSTILASFLNELRRTRQSRADSKPLSARGRKKPLGGARPPVGRKDEVSFFGQPLSGADCRLLEKVQVVSKDGEPGPLPSQGLLCRTRAGRFPFLGLFQNVILRSQQGTAPPPPQLIV